MARRPDIIFIAALLFGVSYTIAAWENWGGPLSIAWKGASVAMLAVWVLRSNTGSAGRIMATVLAFGALGDVLLAISFEAGAVAFLIGHLIASWLYYRHRCGSILIAPVTAVVIAGSGYALTTSPPVAFYAATLGLMAGTASASQLPRPIAIGAWLFVLSDLLIFARLGPLEHSPLPTLLVWPLYFAGQTLIAMGAVRAFAGARRQIIRPAKRSR